MSISNTFKDLAGGSLDDFTPRTKPPDVQTLSAQNLERLAEQQGFVIDNHPVTRRALKSGRVASKDRAQPMTLRLRVTDWNRFSAFCERNGHTVAEGFERLAALADTL
jgi:hypothetical protein